MQGAGGGRGPPLVGLAGTITTVAAVEIGLATYDRDAIHHFRLTQDAAEDVFRTLATESRADRIHSRPGEPAPTSSWGAAACSWRCSARSGSTR